MGFNSLPPLPIISTIFGFLKSVDLRMVGLELGDVPSEFGWPLVLFESNVEHTVPEGVLRIDTAQTGHATVFLDRLDDWYRVEDLEETNSDGSDSTIEVVPPKPYEKTKPGE